MKNNLGQISHQSPLCEFSQDTLFRSASQKLEDFSSHRFLCVLHEVLVKNTMHDLWFLVADKQNYVQKWKEEKLNQFNRK